MLQRPDLPSPSTPPPALAVAVHCHCHPPVCSPRPAPRSIGTKKIFIIYRTNSSTERSMDERCQGARVRPRARGRHHEPGGTTMGATASFPSATASARSPRTWHLGSPRPPDTPTRHHGTIRARNRHEKGTKRTWFGHGFSGREKHNHIFRQHLR